MKLPTTVIAFIRENVESVLDLRLLLVLHGAPGYSTSCTLAASVLDVSRADVRFLANMFERKGLVRIAGDQIELSPPTIEDHLAIADLAIWCARDRGVVLDVLRAMGRVAS